MFNDLVKSDYHRVFDACFIQREELPAVVVCIVGHMKYRRAMPHYLPDRENRAVWRLIKWP